MSNDYQKPFFLEVPSHFFRCTDKLHSVRDNLLIELACNSASFMIRGPRLLLQGLQVRITNRSQQQKNALHLTIRIEPRIIFDLDTHKINDDFLNVCLHVNTDEFYTDNQICCTTALREVYEREDLALRLDMRHSRLYVHTNNRHNEQPYADLSPFQLTWLAMQKPTQQTSSSVRRKQK